MNKLAVILGSGFSYHAGIPMAKGINDYFQRDNSRMLLHFSSEEWKWLDLSSEEDRINGNASYDNIAYSYILNELVGTFKEVKKEFINYEEFYQYIIDEIKNPEFLKNNSGRAYAVFNEKDELKDDNYYYENYIHAFNEPGKSQIYNMINYLISDLLYWRKKFEEFAPLYKPFLSFISGFEQRDIITLNHDQLLEALLEYHGIKYSDGFTQDNSVLEGANKNKLRCFKGDFNSSYNLIKLHGSIDLYQYQIAIQKGSILNSTGEYIYFKTNDYYDKQHPERIDPNTGKVIQDIHWNITPQFITGTRKTELIENDYMYSKLYGEFSERIKNADTLLIIGYSYSDEHVNKQIKMSLSGENLKKVININPKKEFPFFSYHELDIININGISEIKLNV